MTKLLESALAAIRLQPPSVQDRVAEIMLSLVDDGAPEAVAPEHAAAVREGLDQLHRGEYASQEEVAAAFRSFEG